MGDENWTSQKKRTHEFFDSMKELEKESNCSPRVLERAVRSLSNIIQETETDIVETMEFKLQLECMKSKVFKLSEKQLIKDGWSQDDIYRCYLATHAFKEILKEMEKDDVQSHESAGMPADEPSVAASPGKSSVSAKRASTSNCHRTGKVPREAELQSVR